MRDNFNYLISKALVNFNDPLFIAILIAIDCKYKLFDIKGRFH